jgi:hypothetical protein
MSFMLVNCSGPFEGVNAIISNSYITHRVSVQVIDANPKASNPYPANPIITLSGDAVKNGLIYTGDGEMLTDTEGNAKLTNNAITLAIKPYTKISSGSPIKFTITAKALNYISNSQDVVVTNVDSLQYAFVKLLKPSALPSGVTNVVVSEKNIINGTTQKDIVVKVNTNEMNSSGVMVTQTQIQATFPAATVFKDVNNTPITNNNGLTINISNFSNSSPDAVAAISGGLNNVITSIGSAPVGFILAGAVNIMASLGGVDVKSFSQPIQVEIYIVPNTFNPDSKSIIKAGDKVPLWSKNEGNAPWVKEGDATLEKDPSTGRLKVKISVNHLSTWMVAFYQPMCGQPFELNYTSPDAETKTIYIRISSKEGVGQLIEEKTVSINDGDKILFDLPSGEDVIVNVYEGSNASAPLIKSLNVIACATTSTVNNSRTNPNPYLYFDLQTQCKDGLLRYSGPIDYKVSGTQLWQPFTPSSNGTMTTRLLEWDKTYDFRIIYRGIEYRRSRQVLQSEFKLKGNVYSYFGKTDVQQTFFNAPTLCK